MRKKFLLIFCLGGATWGFSDNLIPFSGFDTGVYSLWKSSYQDGRLVDDSDLDFGVFHDGVCSLKLTTWEGNYPWSGFQTRIESTFLVDAGSNDEEHILSAWVKSDREITFNLTLGPLKIQSLVKPEESWKRVTAVGKISGKHQLVITASGSQYDPERLHAGCLWVDSLSLEKGNQVNKWESAGLEVGLVCPVVGNILYLGEPMRILLVVGQTTQPVTVRYRTCLRDCFNQIVSQGSGESFEVTARSYRQQPLSLPPGKRGVLRLEVTGEILSADSSQVFRKEIPLYVIARPEPNFWNPYGLYLQMTVPAMERASRLGLYWNNLLSSAGAITEWNKVYYRDGFLCEKFLPRLKVGKEKYHLRYIGNIANSSFPAPESAWSEKEIAGETITLPPEGKSGPRYLKLNAYREYLETMGRFYSPYIQAWQIIDETNFRGKLYLTLVKEAAKILKKYNQETMILATYPQNMAYVYLRGGPELIDGLYDLGREPRRVTYAAKAARIASPTFPIFFYDCSLRFNYFSQKFNGWGKLAYVANQELTGEEAEKAQQEFIERLNDSLARNIHPLGAGVQTKAICIYHARVPGGTAQCAFDAWGHPAPALVAFSVLNHLLAKGKSLGVVSGKRMEGYLCATGEADWLAIVKPVAGVSRLEIPPGLRLKQLDLFGNEITAKERDKTWIVFHPVFFNYIQATGVGEREIRRFLEN
ncbi:MAG: hypothetical protein NC911_09115 [Candidatus Omnitrophica bacterium]|nr:hypothetical protein [Candidatus Omnitrophota bacterium]